MDVSDIRKSLYLLVHGYPRTRGLSHVESAAAAIGRAPGTVYNKADPGNDSQEFTVSEALALTLNSQDYQFLHAFAAACDHAAIPLLDFRSSSDEELLDLFARAIAAAGEKANTIRHSLADGRITQDELRLIKQAVNKQIRAELELVARLEAISDAF